MKESKDKDEYVSVVELCDTIEKLFENKPNKRNKKEYDKWKESINSQIEKVNKAASFKIYNTVK